MVTKKKYLDLKLYPNKSLNRLSIFFLRFFFFIITICISLYFTSMGAWPVGVFLVLDFFLIYYALTKSFRDSRAYDRVILKEKLFIRKRNRKGNIKEFSLEPSWLRLKVSYYNNSGHLCIISKGKSIIIGNFLNVSELKSLAKIIKEALIKRESEILSN